MAEDKVVGDGGNLTIYERPDKSRYALDVKGRGEECEADQLTFGRARFDARSDASGSWPGSRSRREERPDTGGRARSHGGPKVR